GSAAHRANVRGDCFQSYRTADGSRAARGPHAARLSPRCERVSGRAAAAARGGSPPRRGRSLIYSSDVSICALAANGSTLEWKSISSSASSRTSARASAPYGGSFEYDRKQERLEEVGRELEDPANWSNPERAQELGRERARLSAEVGE